MTQTSSPEKPDQPTTLPNIETLLRWSQFVARETSRFPELLQPDHWQAPYQNNEPWKIIYESLLRCATLNDLNLRLRQVRRAEMVRIALRDQGKLADTLETLRDLSHLADTLISGALDWHYARLCERFGTPMGAQSETPQKMVVLGMGKLGGFELNFSSDIDLIFAYPEKGYAVNERGRETPNDQFFTKLGQAINKSLTEYTADGMVYRVDMRLRPFGDSGPLAVSFAELENYYEIHGRAWERYALVKARVVAGDKTQGQALFDILRPFVYRKYVDFTAIESLRELKRMIHAEVMKKDKVDNIKLGRGGIREIEFITQAFQLIHGGRHPDLQGRELIPMLTKLVEKKFMPAETQSALKKAYLFLRDAENRLQEWNDQQTHELPKQPEQQQYLAESMGFSDYSAFTSELESHRTLVESEFNLLFADPEEDEQTPSPLEQACMADALEVSDIEQLTFPDQDAIVNRINQFLRTRVCTHASQEALGRFKAVLPSILSELSPVPNPQETLDRVLKIVESIMNRSVYFVLLKENLTAVRHLIKLTSLSPWMAEMLSKFPALLDQLIDARVLYEPLTAEELQQEAWHLLQTTHGDDEAFMNRLRQWRHTHVFRVAAADITGHLPVMKVSDYLTWIAEAVMQVVVEYAWRFMKQRSGLPGGQPKDAPCPFMVIGYGKLGGIELGYGSDLDVVFLYHGLNSSTYSEGDRPLENSVYFIRMGQKIISLMTTLMPSGTLYEVDTRLRPDGASGLMVTDFDSFVKYQTNKAWTWEHQALVRTRAIVASPDGKTAFESFKRTFINAPRDRETLRQEVVKMRSKMREALDKSDESRFDLKQGSGGIVDIEFMVQYLVLGYANEYPALSKWSDNIRLLETIQSHDLLPAEEVTSLTEAYRSYRQRYHRLSLQNESTLIAQADMIKERQMVQSIWEKLMP